ncbi:MAG: hypothetical protein FVQ82_08415 [Planctomycetes bacterium]|nr:hypothetical protein [Planctomycetota bacterium]
MTELMTLHARLEAAAYKISDNFCYNCYRVEIGGKCIICGSDDFMRHVDGVGAEYGTEWVIDHIIQDRCESVDDEALFDEMLDECYPEIELGCCSWTPSHVMSELDPTAYRIGVQEHIDSLVEDCQLYESDGDYYQVFDIEEMLIDIESE